MIRFLPAVLLALACLVTPLQAQEYHVGPIVAIDGDTLRVWDGEGKEETIRVLGLDTPETYGADCAPELEAGYAAHGRMQHILNVYAGRVKIERRTALDKYQRSLARVLVGVEGQDVAAIMIAENRARAYTGGRRASWCPQGQPRESLY